PATPSGCRRDVPAGTEACTNRHPEMSGSPRTFRPVSDDRSVQPHDGLFRLVFGSLVHARGAIRALLPELAARLDLDRLTVLNGTFIDAELSRRHSDVCISTSLDGHEALVYFLREPQSSPDP